MQLGLIVDSHCVNTSVGLAQEKAARIVIDAVDSRHGRQRNITGRNNLNRAKIVGDAQTGEKIVNVEDPTGGNRDAVISPNDTPGSITHCNMNRGRARIIKIDHCQRGAELIDIGRGRYQQSIGTCGQTRRQTGIIAGVANQ